MEVQDVILAVGLFPNLAGNAMNYTVNFDKLQNLDALTPKDHTLDRMIKFFQDTLTMTYNPMNPE